MHQLLPLEVVTDNIHESEFAVRVQTMYKDSFTNKLITGPHTGILSWYDPLHLATIESVRGLTNPRTISNPNNFPLKVAWLSINTVDLNALELPWNWLVLETYNEQGVKVPNPNQMCSVGVKHEVLLSDHVGTYTFILAESKRHLLYYHTNNPPASIELPQLALVPGWHNNNESSALNDLSLFIHTEFGLSTETTLVGQLPTFEVNQLQFPYVELQEVEDDFPAGVDTLVVDRLVPVILLSADGDEIYDCDKRIDFTEHTTSIDITVIPEGYRVLIPVNSWRDGEDSYDLLFTPSSIPFPVNLQLTDAGYDITKSPNAITVPYKCYQLSSEGRWVDVFDPTAGLWLALGTSVRTGGMCHGGVVTNPNWSWPLNSAIYLAADGTLSSIPDSSMPVLVGWSLTTDTIVFISNPPVGVMDFSTIDGISGGNAGTFL